MKKLRTLSSRAIALWTVCAATWIAANLRDTLQFLSSTTGGLGAVSLGFSEPAAIGMVLLFPANVAFWWRRSGEPLARAVRRAYWIVIVGYVLLVVLGRLLLTGRLTVGGETTIPSFLPLLIVWATFAPTQVFFVVSGVTFAAARATPPTGPPAGAMKWRLTGLGVLAVEAGAAVYLAFVGWLLAVWFLDDSQAAGMVIEDWYFEAASRAAVAILKGGIFAGVAYLVNLRTVARGFSVRVATAAALLLGAVIATAGVAGAAWFAITKPWL